MRRKSYDFINVNPIHYFIERNGKRTKKASLATHKQIIEDIQDWKEERA